MVHPTMKALRLFAGLLVATVWGELALANSDYVGTDVCAGCHEQPFADWQGSHHDLAMQAVTEKTVLGDFDNAKFTYAGTTSTFYRKDGAFWVRTDNAAGELEERARQRNQRTAAAQRSSGRSPAFQCRDGDYELPGGRPAAGRPVHPQGFVGME